jgi:hypothetical protein
MHIIYLANQIELSNLPKIKDIIIGLNLIINTQLEDYLK